MSDEWERRAYGSWQAGSTQPMAARPIVSSHSADVGLWWSICAGETHSVLLMCGVTTAPQASPEGSRLWQTCFGKGCTTESFTHFVDVLFRSQWKAEENRPLESLKEILYLVSKNRFWCGNTLYRYATSEVDLSASLAGYVGRRLRTKWQQKFWQINCRIISF